MAFILDSCRKTKSNIRHKNGSMSNAEVFLGIRKKYVMG